MRRVPIDVRDLEAERLPLRTRQHAIEFVARRIEEQPGMTHPCVVDHDVGHAVFGAHPLGELLDGVGVGDVEGVCVRHAAARDDLRGGLLDGGLVDVADHQFGTLARERQRGRATNAAARAGHGNQCVAEVFARTANLIQEGKRMYCPKVP